MPCDRRRDADPAPFGRALAGWVRFARYEVRDGVIRPAHRARSEPYDPWKDYPAARGGRGGGGGPPPYAALLELIWSIRLLPGRSGEPIRLQPASQRAVLDWCASHGLLGVLPHTSDVAYLAPRWEELDSMPELRALSLGPVPVQHAYAWGPTGWRSAQEGTWQTLKPTLKSASRKVGTVVPEDFWSDLWGPPRVVTRSLGSGTLATVPLGFAWGRFFPEVPARERDTYPYPVPLSDDFWAAYGEPMDEFLSAATLFSDTLVDLDPERREDEDAVTYRARRTRASDAFFGLVAGVHPTFDLSATSYRRAWSSKSLLASYAIMAFLDLTDGKPVRCCDVCAKPYVSGAYQARYCSARCRQTATQRAYRLRARQRAVDASEPEGRTIPAFIPTDSPDSPESR